MKFSRKVLIGTAFASLLAVSASAAFEKTNTYSTDLFTDVSASKWYAEEVRSTYELGLMNGKGDGIFAPDGNVTVAEAITMAARAASIYAGETIEPADGEWYQMYVNYAVNKGFAADGQFDDFGRPAKRYEVALLFENAMPDGYFTVKNDVKDIPDVSESYSYQPDLLNLYRAGVVMGSDSYGNFRPEDNITRAEAAAIINRVALPENRLAKKLDVYSDGDAYLLSKNTSMVSWKEGINSGWRFDNRGGIPKSSLEGTYHIVTDISDSEGTALIREFNKITTGRISLETQLTIPKASFDGISLEFRNDSDEAVYRLISENGGFSVVNADGTKTAVYSVSDDQTKFVFRIEIDLDNGRSSTVINKKECGSASLLTDGEKLNVLNFRFATSHKDKPSFTVGAVKLTVNYAFNDEFLLESDGTLPYGWQGYNAVSENQRLAVTNGSVSRYFNPVSGTVIANAEFNLDKGQSVSFNLNSGAKNIVSFTSDNTNLYANGVKVYDNYVKNLWYRLRIEAITEESKAVIWLNGRVIGEVPFAQKTTSIDNISITSSAADKVEFDTVNVFEKKHHDDYVPVPVKPVGEEKYTVGMNVCSLWRNGDHYGWSCISAYEDPVPVLGFYDEGNPETADWEIKYLIEHGIDFQAFCWYASAADAPLKDLHLSDHLYDGFMYAKYADMTKYCLLWEAANASKPKDVEAFKKYYAPYFIENFFKDDRYMVIDNKPIMSVFGQAQLAEALGGNAKLKECLDYLEEEVKKLGFDGMIYVCCGSASDAFAEMGFDGCHAYGWGTPGHSLDVNKNNITNSAKNTKMHTIPTVSVGFNSIPWHNVRYPLMTVADYKLAHEWVRDEYLPNNAEKGTWEENLVWLSTWNEYGEGTYIMPSEGNGKFGYIDVIRETYTDEKADESLNLVPSAVQRERINHLFPQYRRLLRNAGYYSEELDEAALDTLSTIDYSDSASTSIVHTKTYEYKEDGLHGMVDGDTHIIKSGLAIDAEKATHLKFTLEVPTGTYCSVFFLTEDDTTWNEAKKNNFTATSDTLTEYVVDMTGVNTWLGKITHIRIDPGEVAAGSGDPVKNRFHIKSIDVLAEKEVSPKDIIINGITTTMQMPYETSSDGQLLIAFDPEIALDYKLNIFHTWDYDTKTLTLETDNHTVIYTVGSSEYILDGTKKNLGYEMYAFDGLPMIPVKGLCEDVGYNFTVNESGIAVVETNQKPYYDEISGRVPGQWEFNAIGDTEGWSSTRMNLYSSDGYLTAESNSDSTDPILEQANEVNLAAAKYKSLEIRCRYDYPASVNHTMVIYFTTNRVGFMSEDLTIRLPLDSTDTKGEWKTYTVDLTQIASWKDIIKKIRFDPFAAPGNMDIDYIRFIEDPDYIEEAATGQETSSETDALLASGITYEIRNGDAEQAVHDFTSPNAVITIVKDPENAENNCFLVMPKDDTKQWIYIEQKVIFKPGTKYTGSCDVKLASHGTVTDVADDFKADLIANARYGGSFETSVEHMTVQRASYTRADGWVHYEFEFTVPDTSDVRSKDQMTFFANPVSDKGVGYYIDNIIIQETN